MWLRPRYKIPEFFTIAPVFTSTLTFSAEIAAIRPLYIGLSITEKQSFWLGLEPPRADRGLSRPTGAFRATIGVCKILSRSVEIWQYEGQNLYI